MKSKVYYESDRIYSCRANGEKDRPERNRVLAVPARLARTLPEELKFRCVLTEEGILYRPADGSKMALPEWAENGNGASHE